MKKTIKVVLVFALITSILLFLGCEKKLTEEQIAEQKEYMQKADEIVGNKGDLNEAINIYAKLIEIFPVDNEYRQKVLTYIMDGSMELVRSDDLKEVQKGLDIALELDKLVPGDFYVQNRILGAYKKFAEKEMEAKNWEKAKEWTQKGLQIRFDNMVMKTHLEILIKEAEDFLKKKKYAEAKSNLDSVLEIASIADNKDLFTEEAKEANELLSRIK